MTTRLFLSLAATLFYSHFTAAAIKIDAIRGASNYDITNSPFQVMGGTGGDIDLCSRVREQKECNTCEAGLFACNTQRIFPERELYFSFSSDSINDNTVYTAVVRAASSSSGINGDISGIRTSTVNGKNQTGTVTVQWGDFCDAIETSGSSTGSTDGACEGGALSGSVTVGFIQGTTISGTQFADSVEVKVRVDTPNPGLVPDRDEVDDCDTSVSPQQGICYYSLFPGDEKAFVDDLTPTGLFPSSGIFKVKYLRFFYSTVGFADVTPISPSVDVEISTTSTTGSAVETLSNKLGGLANDQLYYTRIATVDEGGNIADFTSDINITAICADVNNPNADCPYMVQPSAVLGLLPKNFNCFIASASYGSSMEHHVQLFRQFRGEVLMKSEVGRKFARWYYKLGPYPAAFLMRNPALKPLARAALWPAWGVAWISLHYGVWAGLLISFLPLIAGILIFKISRKKSHATTVI